MVSDLYVSACAIPNGALISTHMDIYRIYSTFRLHESCCEAKRKTGHYNKALIERAQYKPCSYSGREMIFHIFYISTVYQKCAIFGREFSNLFFYHKSSGIIRIETPAYPQL